MFLKTLENFGLFVSRLVLCRVTPYTDKPWIFLLVADLFV